METVTAVDPHAAARYFVGTLGCTAFAVWGTKAGRCLCGDPHDGTRKHGPDNIGKHPAAFHGFKDATADVDQIDTFLGNPGTPNYGLNPPEGVLVIDVDGADGLASWEALQAKHGPLPVTLTTLTANGRHYFYRWPGPGPMPKGKLFGFVVRRHDDGYVIGPGSVHPTGFVYDTLRQSSGFPYDIADLPVGWVDAAARPPATPFTIGDVLPEPGGRHDWLRDKARLYAGTVRDPAALKAALLADNAKLSQPKSEAEVDRAIGEVLAKFPADPVEVDPTSGSVVRRPARVWAEDIELAAPTAVAFPPDPAIAAFEGLAGEAIDSLAGLTSASRIGMLTTLLSAWGGIFGMRTAYHGEQPSVLFSVLIGETGRARKGTTTAAVWTALERAMAGGVLSVGLTSRRWDGLASGEALVRILAEEKGAIPTTPVYGLIVEEEFERLLRRMRSSEGYQSTLDVYLRQAFDARMLQHLTATKTQRVMPPYGVSILGNVTRETLQSTVTPEMARSGFANRFLWVPIRERDVPVTGAVPWAFEGGIAKALSDARVAWVPGSGSELDPAALSLLNDYAAHLRDLGGLPGAMSARLHVIAARVALVHAAMERATSIPVDFVARAIALTEYTRAGIAWSFRDDLGDEDANALFAAISERFPDGLSGREAHAVIGRSSRLIRARDLLLTNHLIVLDKLPANSNKLEQTSGGGRPKTVYRAVSPARFVGFVPHARARENGEPEADSPESVIHAQQTPPNYLQTTNELPPTTTNPIEVDRAAAALEHICRDYAAHQHSGHQRTAAGPWSCTICFPEDFA